MVRDLAERSRVKPRRFGSIWRCLGGLHAGLCRVERSGKGWWTVCEVTERSNRVLSRLHAKRWWLWWCYACIHRHTIQWLVQDDTFVANVLSRVAPCEEKLGAVDFSYEHAHPLKDSSIYCFN
jgi:hypothetical protein